MRWWWSRLSGTALQSKMALPPRFAGHRLGSPSADHVLEFYWDFTVGSPRREDEEDDIPHPDVMMMTISRRPHGSVPTLLGRSSSCTRWVLYLPTSHLTSPPHTSPRRDILPPPPAPSHYLHHHPHPSHHHRRQELFPYLARAYPNRVQILFRHQVQPWHPQSTLLHEAALAVERIASQSQFQSQPFHFFPYAEALFKVAADRYVRCSVSVWREGGGRGGGDRGGREGRGSFTSHCRRSYLGLDALG